MQVEHSLDAVVGHQQFPLKYTVGHGKRCPSSPGGQPYPLAIRVVGRLRQGDIDPGSVEFHPHQVAGAVIGVAGLTFGRGYAAGGLAGQVAAAVKGVVPGDAVVAGASRPQLISCVVGVGGNDSGGGC